MFFFTIVFAISCCTLVSSANLYLNDGCASPTEYHIQRYLQQLIASQNTGTINIFTTGNENITYEIMMQKLCKELKIPVIINPKYQYISDRNVYLVFEKCPDILEPLSLHFKLQNVFGFPTFVFVWQCHDASNQVTAAKSLFKLFWRHNYTSVEILAEIPGINVKILSFVPFSINHCGHVSEIEENELWSLKNNSKAIQQGSYTMKSTSVSNMYGCPLNINVRNRPPDVAISRREDKSYSFEGSSGELLKIAMDKINFSVDITFMDQPKLISDQGEMDRLTITDNRGICCNYLVNRSRDIIVGTFSHVLLEKRAELSYPLYQECFLFFVPCDVSNGRSLIKLYSAFSLTTWIFLILCTMLILIIMYIIGRVMPNENRLFKNVLHNSLYLFGAFLNISMAVRPKSNSLRILIIHTIFAYLIMSVAFEAFLKSYKSTLNYEGTSITSINDLDESNLTISGAPQAFIILNNTSENSKIITNLVNKFRTTRKGTFESLIDKIIIERFSIFGPQRLISYYMTKDGKFHHVCSINPCLLKLYSSPFIFRKGSPLIKPFNNITRRLFESGIVQNLWAMKDPVLRRGFMAAKITLGDVSKGFYVLFYGLSVAVLIFVLEIMVSKMV